MADHSGIVIASGAGNLGVTIFFVLSGFLITTLLLEERARHGHVSLRRFYWRRALRLLPALGVSVTLRDAGTAGRAGHARTYVGRPRTLVPMSGSGWVGRTVHVAFGSQAGAVGVVRWWCGV